MVKVVKDKSFLSKIKNTTSSKLFFPYVLLFVVLVSIPVTYLVMQNPLEIRQRAATITGGGITIDTEETSFQKAAREVVPPTTLNVILAIVILAGISSGTIAVILYKRNFS